MGDKGWCLVVLVAACNPADPTSENPEALLVASASHDPRRRMREFRTSGSSSAGENRHEKVGEQDAAEVSTNRASPTPGGVHPWEAHFLRSAG
jgi:hypothetical protein